MRLPQSQFFQRLTKITLIDVLLGIGNGPFQTRLLGIDVDDGPNTFMAPALRGKLYQLLRGGPNEFLSDASGALVAILWPHPKGQRRQLLRQ